MTQRNKIPTDGQALAPNRARTALEVIPDPAKTPHQQMAEIGLSAVTRGATSAMRWAQKSMGELGINEAVATVESYAAKAAAGDLDAAKQMLMAQALTLDAIFNEMAVKASTVVKTNADGSWSITGNTLEVLLRTGFKAQAQCRTTLQTLGELVNPRSVAFIKQAPGSQANVTNGPQQVVNGTGTASHAENAGSKTNKLLEGIPSERLDTRAQAAPIGANQIMEAVGEVHRANDQLGKVSRLPERRKARSA